MTLGWKHHVHHHLTFNKPPTKKIGKALGGRVHTLKELSLTLISYIPNSGNRLFEGRLFRHPDLIHRPLSKGGVAAAAANKLLWEAINSSFVCLPLLDIINCHLLVQ